MLTGSDGVLDGVDRDGRGFATGRPHFPRGDDRTGADPEWHKCLGSVQHRLLLAVQLLTLTSSRCMRKLNHLLSLLQQHLKRFEADRTRGGMESRMPRGTLQFGREFGLAVLSSSMKIGPSGAKSSPEDGALNLVRGRRITSCVRAARALCSWFGRIRLSVSRLFEQSNSSVGCYYWKCRTGGTIRAASKPHVESSTLA